MIKYIRSRLFEKISDLIFLTLLYIIIIYLIYNYTVVDGIPIPDKEILMKSTIFGDINQYNFFNTIFYLPMYLFKVDLKQNTVLILGIFLYIFGMYSLNIFRKIISNITNVDNKITIFISSYLSMFILVFFPFNIYNLGHLTGSQYIFPMIQMFLMNAIVLEIIFILIYLNNMREIIKHLTLLLALLLFVNYQFFLASLLIYGILLVFLAFFTNKNYVFKSIIFLIFLLLFEAFAALFNVNIYSERSYISYLPTYSFPLNTNYHIYFLWGLYNSVSWLDYIRFAINHFSFAFLLGSWNFNYIFLGNLINQNNYDVYIFYFSVVNFVSALPFLALKFDKKLNTLILSYFSFIIIITIFGPQISVWAAETKTEIGNIASYAFDAPMYYEPLLQILISILAPLSLITLYKLYFKNKKLIIALMLVLIVILSISSYEFFAITAYSINSNLNQANDIINYLENLNFPKAYFLLKNNDPQNAYLLMLYPNSQYITFSDFDFYNLTYLYYILGYSFAYPGYLASACQLNPRIAYYVLNYFGFKYLVTDQAYLAKIYNESQLFKIVYENNNYYILKIKRINYNTSYILLTTSTRILVNILNNGTYPLWLSQPYLYNLSTIKDLAKNHIIYVPWYFNIYELYTYIPYKYVINFAHYNVNNFVNYEWKSAFNDFVAQETWGQNYILFNNYQYQNFIAPNYGVIYTDNPNTSFEMDYNIPNGRYIIISQILYSNVGGEVAFIINNETFTISTKSNNGSYFAFTYLGEVNVSNNSLKIEIINKSGFNAIEVMYIIPYNVYTKYYDELYYLSNTFKKVY